MSLKKGATKSKIVAKIVTEEKGPCAFCQRDVDDEIIYGKLYAIGSIKCHYFCVLLSCCMVQKGRDEDGLFGFLYPDILAEIERSKKHKCSYCNKEGATLGCSVSQCRKQFHLPCGREKNAVSLFYGSYKSFCQNHTPKQKIADNVMAKAKARMQEDRKNMKLMRDGVIVETRTENTDPESVCVICYEPVQAYPTIQTFWPPCCARDAWFHRTCLQRMALSAGMHYLKCPLCNDKEHFYDAVFSQGYYVPDRDAAWELEQNAFADIYERPLHCDMEHCQCPMGREHDSDSGAWDIKLCLLCGSSGAHAQCLSATGDSRLLCTLCRTANTDVEQLADTIEAVMVTEQAQIARAERRPIMPSRMSLRRTKQRLALNGASSSRSQETATRMENEAKDTPSSREDLNLKPPKRPQLDRNHVLKDIQNKLLSPNKMLEQLYEKISAYDVDAGLVEQVKETFQKPKPLSVKKKMVDAWDIKLCLLCGSSGAHAQCLSATGDSRLLCTLCRTANTDVEQLADTIEAVMVTEQAQIARAERRPIMPSRMSLRRTKQRLALNGASSSRSQETATRMENEAKDTPSSREDLNLKPPKRPQLDRNHVLKDIQNKLLSPNKMLEQLYEKISAYDVDAGLVEQVKETFQKPKPLSVKKKMVDNLLDNILNNMTRDKSKNKEPVKEWCSPKKAADITADNAQEFTTSHSPKYTIKSPCKSPTLSPLKIILKKSPNTTPNKTEDTENINDKKTPRKENDDTLNDVVVENNEPMSISDDESSTSTFQLAPEFIADNSNDSLQIFETPKLKTVDIQKDSSLEISENDEIVNVNVVKMEETSPNKDFIKNLNIKSPVKTEKCAFKFSPLDKETLEKDNVGFDLESFKNRYLDEVGRDVKCDFKCKFKHNHSDLPENSSRLKSVIDFAMEASNERKRSISDTEDIPKKKRKVCNESRKKKLRRIKSEIKKGKKKHKYKESTDIEVSNGQENLKLSLQERKKKKTKVSLKDKQIKVKIQWKKKQLKVQISKAKVKKVKKDCRTLKQYVLQYKDVNDSVLEKPQYDVTPIKRKYVKLEKSPDNLKQTSIQSFFKVQMPKKE